MAITKLNPNCTHLGGPVTEINDYVASEAITPGHLVEYVNDSGTLKWGLHDSADDVAGAFIALEQEELNQKITDAYSAGDLMKVAHFAPGATFYGFVTSGNYAVGAKLQSNGDGTFKAAASGTVKFVILEAKNVTTDTRARIEVI